MTMPYLAGRLHPPPFFRGRKRQNNVHPYPILFGALQWVLMIQNLLGSHLKKYSYRKQYYRLKQS